MSSQDTRRGVAAADTGEAVRSALYRYARAVDTRNLTLLSDCMTEDVVLHRVDGARSGREAVLEFYRSVFDGPTIWSKHMVTNVAAVPDGDSINVAAYFQAVSRTARGAALVLGEYEDRVVECEDGMRISEKRIDVQQTFPLALPDE